MIIILFLCIYVIVFLFQEQRGIFLEFLDQFSFTYNPEIIKYTCNDSCSFAWYLKGDTITGGFVFNSELVINATDNGEYELTVATLDKHLETVIVDREVKTFRGIRHKKIRDEIISKECVDWRESSNGKWIRRELIKNVKHYPYIPDNKLSHGGNCFDLFDKSPFDNPYLAMQQDYVWVPHKCILPWKSNIKIKNTPKRFVFMGTSRIINLSMDFKKFTMNQTLGDIIYEPLKWGSLNNIKALNKLTEKYCNKKDTVIIFSCGFWESITGLNQKYLYLDRYRDYMFQILDNLISTCGDGVILITEPAVHPLSVTSHIQKRKVEVIPVELKWHRTMAMNDVMREFASNKNVLFVDSEKLTSARFDASLDSVHYVCGECNIKKCIHSGGMGSDVTHTIIQLLIRQIELL